MIHSIQQEFIEKVYWENPDDPDDNGYAYVCNRCGQHGQVKEWADHHACDVKQLQEARFWKKHYSTCYECGKEVKWLADDCRCKDCTSMTPEEMV